MKLPEFHLLEQAWPADRVEDIRAVVAEGARAAGLPARVQPGMSIAITAGSRGISDKPAVLRALVDEVRALGARPFLFPAMGSHGGATAEGQVELLRDLGISEASMGAPIRSSMAVVEIGRTRSGLPVYLDEQAAGADGIIAVNRIKKHTDFGGEFGSGLMKMLAIGMGKQAQALAIHQHGAPGLRHHIPEVAEVVIARAKLLLGVAIVENAYGRAHTIACLPPARIPAGEREMFALAGGLAARLPVEALDVLIVEELGKEISGTGMDTHVIGRIRIAGEPEPASPRIATVVVLDVTDASHGNAVGIGLADVTTTRLVGRIDRDALYANVITSHFYERGKLPLAMAGDREAVETALHLHRRRPPEEVRVAWIKNTASLDRILVSAALLPELRGRPGAAVEPVAQAMTFDAAGRLVSPLRSLAARAPARSATP
jgi:hypothetical protein